MPSKQTPESQHLTDWRPSGHEVQPRTKLPMFNVVVDILVWICCIAFAATVAGSYLMVTL